MQPAAGKNAYTASSSQRTMQEVRVFKFVPYNCVHVWMCVRGVFLCVELHWHIVCVCVCVCVCMCVVCMFFVLKYDCHVRRVLIKFYD